MQSGTHALTLKIQEYHQHCGGMPPTPEMEANSTRPASELVYYLYEGTRPTRTSDFTRIVSNSDGIITLDLANGNYRMIQEDKLLSLEEFITLKNIEGIHYSAKPGNCYEDWRNRPDLSISLTSDTTMQFTINPMIPHLLLCKKRPHFLPYKNGVILKFERIFIDVKSVAPACLARILVLMPWADNLSFAYFTVLQ